jgi:hypothetical protein
MVHQRESLSLGFEVISADEIAVAKRGRTDFNSDKMFSRFGQTSSKFRRRLLAARRMKLQNRRR